eukprot:558789-Rhodomonas_salina.2
MRTVFFSTVLRRVRRLCAPLLRQLHTVSAAVRDCSAPCPLSLPPCCAPLPSQIPSIRALGSVAGVGDAATTAALLGATLSRARLLGTAWA